MKAKVFSYLAVVAFLVANAALIVWIYEFGTQTPIIGFGASGIIMLNGTVLFLSGGVVYTVAKVWGLKSSLHACLGFLALGSMTFSTWVLSLIFAQMRAEELLFLPYGAGVLWFFGAVLFVLWALGGHGRQPSHDKLPFKGVPGAG